MAKQQKSLERRAGHGESRTATDEEFRAAADRGVHKRRRLF
jgi:hypothetical protein